MLYWHYLNYLKSASSKPIPPSLQNISGNPQKCILFISSLPLVSGIGVGVSRRKKQTFGKIHAHLEAKAEWNTLRAQTESRKKKFFSPLLLSWALSCDVMELVRASARCCVALSCLTSGPWTALKAEYCCRLWSPRPAPILRLWIGTASVCLCGTVKTETPSSCFQMRKEKRS